MDTKERLKVINQEIKKYFFINKKHQVRKNILPNNSKSLRKAVQIAKNGNPSELPDTM